MKYALPLPFLLVMTACNFRIYINGEFSHKVKGYITRWGSYDSCFVLEQNDSVPPGAVYISDTRLLTPGFWNIMAPVETLLNLAEDEARTGFGFYCGNQPPLCNYTYLELHASLPKFTKHLFQ